ncbi:C25 family cysteine peptidase [Roseiconus nitratireducens]|uniref:C25 family cysteine peptidase n=1 Tax=Roseiconus nitratireducens TaxID=2605748 RepID=UPI0013755F25|nr:C25 family cysteine peptidase [Roseiconus nitratireducens]
MSHLAAFHRIWLCLTVVCGTVVVTPAFGQAPSAENPAAEKLAAEAPAAVAICPTHFRDALQEWIDYRQQQGIQVTVVESARSAEQVVQAIRRVQTPSLRFVLLVGDAPAIGSTANPDFQVPMHYVSTTVSAKFGSTPTMATDFPYGDFDADGLADAAVGRLPVDTPDQLSNLIGRIKAYETSQDFSSWRNRVELVGGVGGFGMLADAAIESVTRLIVTASLPTAVRTSIAYGSPGHLFYPRKRFTETITDRFNRGCRFWVYAGHGLVNQLDRVPPGPSGVPVLDRQSLQHLHCDPQSAPIAVLLCCFTGAIDAQSESLAEQMLVHDGGPIAVIAGNRVTMPYGNASLTLGLIDAVYGRDEIPQNAARHLGQAWMQTLRQLHQADSAEKNQLRTMIDGVATLVSPAGVTLADERREHAALYSLLGDPLLELHPPASIQIETATGHDADSPVRVRVTCPIDGVCSVTLDHPLGERRADTTDQRLIDPNQTTLAQIKRPIRAERPEEFELLLPETRSGVLAVRVHVSGEQTWATGGAQTFVRPPVETKPLEATPVAAPSGTRPAVTPLSTD